MDILLGKFCRQVRIIWNSCFGQFVYSVGGRGLGKGGYRDNDILASCKPYFIRVHGNMVQLPSVKVSIGLSLYHQLFLLFS